MMNDGLRRPPFTKLALAEERSESSVELTKARSVYHKLPEIVPSTRTYDANIQGSLRLSIHSFPHHSHSHSPPRTLYRPALHPSQAKLQPIARKIPGKKPRRVLYTRGSYPISQHRSSHSTPQPYPPKNTNSPELSPGLSASNGADSFPL